MLCLQVGEPKNNKGEVNKSETGEKIIKNEEGNEFSFLDIIWFEWLKGIITAKLGPFEYTFVLPNGWHYFVNEEEVSITSVTYYGDIIAFVALAEGTATHHELRDAETSQIRIQKTTMEFKTETSDGLLTPVFSEEQLNDILTTDAIYQDITRKRLPRILFQQAYYYPISLRILGDEQKFNRIITTPPKELDFREIEGPFIEANFDPIGLDYDLKKYIEIGDSNQIVPE
jgi:hypothetical protein